MEQNKPGHCAECALRERERIKLTPLGNADILFVGAYPLEVDIRLGPFMGKHSSLLRRMLAKLQDTRPANRKLRTDFAYALQCSPAFDEQAKKFAVTAENVNHCSVMLKENIDHFQPKVLMALGGDALRALGFSGKPSDYRGGIYQFQSAKGAIPLVASFHLAQVGKSPGLLNTLEKDLRKAAALADGSLSDVPLEVVTPQSCTEICAWLDKLYAEAEASFASKGCPLAIAVDTETSSLTPYRKEDRVIAVSLSHKMDFGLAFPLEHKANPFGEAELVEILGKLEKLLASEHVSILTANGKFDMQWLKHRYGLKIRDAAYDIILAEHVLDEDKKGEYSLKDITCDRFPSMGRYEGELKEHLASCWKAKDEKIAELKEAHKKHCQDLVLSWWVNLDAEKRREACAPWLAKGLVALSDLSSLIEVRYRKLHGELVIPKKYQEALYRFLANLPEEELAKHLKLPELEVPKELETRTYEDADLATLLSYAAIDALATRKIVKDQRQDFDSEINRVRRTEASLGYSLQTRPCHAVYYDNTIPLSTCLAAMEFNGIRLDRERCREYCQTVRESISQAEDFMFREVGRKFSLSASAPDLARILYTEMKLPVKKLTETGAPSTDADTIKELVDEFRVPFLEKLLVYRKLDKCLHTYLENWLNISEYDGKIHTNFNQHGTSTYRLSSRDPNLQNTPFSLKEAKLNLKSLFLPDSEEYEIYELDISNAEMRVLTAYSRDEALTDAFNHGKDLHCLTAAGISNYTYDDLKAHKEDKETDQYRKRQLAKKVNFGKRLPK